MPEGPFGLPRLTSIGPFVKPSTTLNPAGEQTKEMAEKLDNKPAQFLVDNGAGFEPPYTTIDEVKYSQEITDKEVDKVQDAMNNKSFEPKLCYSNALTLWSSDNDIKYVEGYAMIDDDFPIQEHAWNVINGKLIDTTTTEFKYYWGHPITDNDTLRFYLVQAEQTDSAPIIFDWMNDYQYLREQGVNF